MQTSVSGVCDKMWSALFVVFARMELPAENKRAVMGEDNETRSDWTGMGCVVGVVTTTKSAVLVRHVARRIE